VDSDAHPTQNTLRVIVSKETKQWQNIFQQKLTEMTEACHAVLDNGVPRIATAHYYTVIQLALN
jgi:hypothetical protein